MKKLTNILALFFLSSLAAKGQSIWTPGSGSTITTTTTGTVFLQGGVLDMANPTTDGLRTIIANSDTFSLNILSGHNGGDGAYIGLHTLGKTTHPGCIGFHTIGPNSAFDFWNLNGTTNTPLLKINLNALYVKNGTIDMTTFGGDNLRTIIANSSNNSLNILSGTNGGNGAYIGLHSTGVGAGLGGSMGLHTAGSAAAFDFWNIDGVTSTPLMKVNKTAVFVKQGVIDMTTHGGDNLRKIIANSANNSLEILSGTNGGNGAHIGLHSLGMGGGLGGAMGFHTAGMAPFDFWTHNGLGFVHLMKLNSTALYLDNGRLDMTMPGGDGTRTIIANSATNSLQILSGTNGGDGAHIGLHTIGVTSGHAGSMALHTVGSGGFDFWNINGGSSAHVMKIRNDGKVAIGKNIIATGSVPNDYLLYVEKGILTEKLRVANRLDLANWSDFVFNDDYDLMPLSKVEAYIKKNKHLPDIPSTKEVVQDGIDVVQMEAKLLQKIEELTLYVLQQQKEIEILKRKSK